MASAARAHVYGLAQHRRALVGRNRELEHLAHLFLAYELRMQHVELAAQVLEATTLAIELLLTRRVDIGRVGACVRLRQRQRRALADGRSDVLR